MKDFGDLKVAIVHDWLVGGGAEKVVLELHKMFPDAPIYTSYATPQWCKKLDNKVITGWLQHFGKLRKFMVLPRIWWFTHLDLSQYDLVISSSGNGEAFAVKTGPQTLHVNYCNTPTHYYWRHYEQYVREPGFGVFNPLARMGLKLLVAPLRHWDYRAAQRADVIIANSTHIQSDIKRYYDRDAVVVHPPVDTQQFGKITAVERTGLVTVGRLVPMKRVDLIVDAATALQLPLTVIGNGPAYADLAKRAGPLVTFVRDGSDDLVKRSLAAAKAFVFASHEDFGIAPIEALASGTPVIAYKAGGALDYITPNKTGQFFDKQTVDSLKTALLAFNADKYNSGDIKKAAQAFSIDQFHKNMRRVLQDVLQ